MNQLQKANGNVLSFLELSLSNQREQMEAMSIILDEMRQIKDVVEERALEIDGIKEEMLELKSEMLVLAKQINDENRLLPSEIDELHVVVRDKSIELVKQLDVDEEDFKKEVGKMRRFIFWKANKRFGVSKYIHIRRKDFKDSLEFVRNFSIEDYIRGRRNPKKGA